MFKKPPTTGIIKAACTRCNDNIRSRLNPVVLKGPQLEEMQVKKVDFPVFKRKHLAVAGTNDEGEAVTFVSTVSVTEQQVEDGCHIEFAKMRARKNGLNDPIMCFDSASIEMLVETVRQLITLESGCMFSGRNSN